MELPVLVVVLVVFAAPLRSSAAPTFETPDFIKKQIDGVQSLIAQAGKDFAENVLKGKKDEANYYLFIKLLNVKTALEKLKESGSRTSDPQAFGRTVRQAKVAFQKVIDQGQIIQDELDNIHTPTPETWKRLNNKMQNILTVFSRNLSSIFGLSGSN